MYSSGGAAFKDINPFKSRMAGDAFDSQDPLAKGTSQLVQSGSTSFVDGSEEKTAAIQGFPEKADSYGVKGDSGKSIEILPHTPDSGMSAKEEGFRNSNERRLGTEEYNRLSGEGIQDADKGGRYTGREVIAEMRDGRNGKTTEEMAAHYQSLADSGTKFNDKAQEFLSKHHGVKFGAQQGSSEAGGGGGAGNDNEGGVSDTEAQRAQKLADRFKYDVKNGFNHQARNYKSISDKIANQALSRADQRDIGELTELRKQIDRQPLYWKARSDVQTGDYLGDIWNFNVSDFKMPDPLKGVEAPDISGIADDYMDRIDSIKPKL